MSRHSEGQVNYNSSAGFTKTLEGPGAMSSRFKSFDNGAKNQQNWFYKAQDKQIQESYTDRRLNQSHLINQ